jgi:hypothetical protein
MWNRFALLGLLLPLLHCAAPLRAADVVLSPPLTVRLIASGPQTPTPRELNPGDLVQASEQVELEVMAIERPAHIYVALYEPAAASTLLYGGATHRRASPGELVRLSVPRRVMPGGGPATEVRLFVVASATPLSQVMCPLLRVRCPLDGAVAPAAETEPGKKQCDAIPDSPATPGLHSPATILPVVIKFE